MRVSYSIDWLLISSAGLVPELPVLKLCKLIGTNSANFYDVLFSSISVKLIDARVLTFSFILVSRSRCSGELSGVFRLFFIRTLWRGLYDVRGRSAV